MTDHDEAARLAALRSLQILDTPRQDCFDRITKLCARLLDCPIAVISLVDQSRQWFLSAEGIALRETTRNISFCDHAVRSGRSLLVSDARKDGRFRDCPQVTGEPRIRSYLGQPIANYDGTMMGTLCVADPRPSYFTSQHLDLLTPMAKVVETLIQAHYQRIETAYLSAHLDERSHRLEKSNRIFKQAEKVAKIGSWEFEIPGSALTWSDEIYSICELAKGDSITLDQALDFFVAEDRPDIERALAESIKQGIPANLEASIRTANGLTKRVRVMGERFEGNTENPPRMVGIVQDISQAYHDHLALKRAADHDMLTGLYNRHAFDRHLSERIVAHSRLGQDSCVLLIDLDGFKDVNDTFGHLVGDVILEEISARIARAIPPDAVAARWGGDEFAIIAPIGTSTVEASEIGEELIKAIANHVEISGRRVSVSATCGLVQCKSSPVAREVMRMADLALYHGKAREPGRVHLYNASLEHANKLRQEAISTVRHALDEDRLFAGYQPIVHLPSNALVGFEALMRLNTRNGERLTATQVLPAILDPVLSRDIGERMVNLVCQDFASIQAAQPKVQFISINATEADLLARDFSDRLLSALKAKRIPPQRVTLEITETMLLVSDASTVQAVLSKLRRSGMQIALDDFGTGFSSLSHLRDFPIDKVKIDGSFVQKICSEHQTRLIVQALIGMAKNLGIEVIAEGIESEEQRHLLLQMGCYYGQGFLISPAETSCRLKTLRLPTQSPPAADRAAA